MNWGGLVVDPSKLKFWSVWSKFVILKMFHWSIWLGLPSFNLGIIGAFNSPFSPPFFVSAKKDVAGKKKKSAKKDVAGKKNKTKPIPIYSDDILTFLVGSLPGGLDHRFFLGGVHHLHMW